MKRYRDAAWGRWQREYVTALHERNNRQHMPIAANFDVGGIVMVKGKSKKGGKWKIGIISEVFQGIDDQI